MESCPKCNHKRKKSDEEFPSPATCPQCGFDFEHYAAYLGKRGEGGESGRNTVKRRGRFILGIFVFVVAVLWFGRMYAVSLAKQKIDHTIQSASRFVDITYGDLAVDPLSKKIELENVTVGSAATRKIIAQIGRCIIEGVEEGESGGLPRKMQMTLSDLQMGGTAGEALDKELKKLGLDNALLDGFLDYEYHAAGKQLVVKNIFIKADRAGSLRISGEGVGIHVDINNLLKLLLSNFMNAALVSVNAEYHDESLFRRIMASEAEKSGKAVADVRGAIIKTLEKKISMEKNRLQQDNYRSMIKFIEDPKILRLRAQPNQPLLFRTLMKSKQNPEEWLKALNIQVKAD
ncbi:hypothetical protein ACFL9T_20590 [Thermodesulfobacteriota bacterium]